METMQNTCTFFPVRISEHGMLLNPDVASTLKDVVSGTSTVTDLFIYSHGWWTNEVQAMEEAKHFSVEFTKRLFEFAGQSPLALRLPASSVAIGIHWPAMLSDCPHAFANYLELATFFPMERRADIVGENGVSLLAELIYQIRKDIGGELRVHLVGHSFGCRVVCSALRIALRAIAQEFGKIPRSVSLNVVLLQAAFDHEELEHERRYGVLCTPDLRLRLLATRSDEDRVLRLYPDAERLIHLLSKSHIALGAVGPSPRTVDDFGGKDDVVVKSGFTYADVASKSARLIVADLTPLHRECPERRNPVCGHHMDVFSDEICHLLAGFLFRPIG